MEHEHRNSIANLFDRRSFVELLSGSTKLLEESFAELELEEKGLDFFQSQLQATLPHEQSSLTENQVADNAWDDDDHQDQERMKMKVKSFVTDSIESFDDRLKRKMSESATADDSEVPPAPHLSALPTVERNPGHSVTVQGASIMKEIMEEMTDSDSSECESTKMSSNDRDREFDNNMSESPKMFSSRRDRLDRKIKAREAVEDRLRRSQTAKIPPRPPTDSISPKLSTRESFQERLEKKMSESTTDKMRATTEASPRRHPKLSAKESFEERLKKKMMESDTDKMRATRDADKGQSATRPKLSAKESFDERLKKKMMESASVESTSSVKPSPLPPVTSRKSTESESYEQRVKKKMSEYSTVVPMNPSNPRPVPLPSNAIPDKSNVKGSLVHSRKLTAKESFEERLKKKMNESADSERSSNNGDRLEKKIRARKAVEDRLKREMGGHEEVPSEKSTSPIESRNISVKESTIQKKMSESADIGRSSNNSDRLESKIRARKAVEDRLKRRMAGHAEELSEKSTAAKESSIEIQRRKMKEFELNVAERQGRNTPPAKGDSVGQTGLCVICHNFPRSHLFVPCGHMCVCLRCSDRVMERTCKCPMCSETVMMVTRVRNSKLN